MRIRALAGLVTLSSMLSVIGGVAPANAASDQADLFGPAPFAATAQSMWQTDNVVFALDYRNGILYAGGSFANVRPPGAAPGHAEEPQANVAAFDAATGEFISSWRPKLNGTVFALKVSPDGSRLYIGGDFTKVDDSNRLHVAAFDLTDPRNPALLDGTAFAARTSGRVYAIAASDTTLYVGGTFAYAGGEERGRVAAFDAADGSLLPFVTTVTGGFIQRPTSVQALALSSSGQLFVGGMFDEVNGEASHALAAVNPLTGQFLTTFTAPHILEKSTVTTMTVNLGTLYVAGRTDRTPSKDRLEGVMAMDENTGAIVFGADGERCLGDSFATLVLDSTLWVGTHAHDCRTLGGWHNRNPRVFMSVLAQSATTGALKQFFPDSSGTGSIPGSFYNTRALATDGTRLFVGGGFAKIGGVTQENLAIFSPDAPSAPPRKPVATAEIRSTDGGSTVYVRWETTFDTDTRDLTYTVRRDGVAEPIASKLRTSEFWEPLKMHAKDTNVHSGESLTYSVEVSDGTTTIVSTKVTIVVP